MNLLKLSAAEQDALRVQIQSTSDTKILKKAQTIMWLNEGISAIEISQRLQVPRRTIYHWVTIYNDRKTTPFLSRLEDRLHPGRPPEKSETILEELEQILCESPREHGYYYSGWTAPLLSQFFQREKDLNISPRTIRRCLKKLGKSWKRPRYGLARQSPTWQQGKGGFNVDSRIAQEP